MRQLRDRIRRYVSFVAWFIRDAFLRYRWRLLAVAVGSFLGVTLQGAAVFATFHYAQALEGDSSLQLLGFALNARSSVGLLVAVAAAFLVLILCAAVVITWSRLEGIAIARDYSDFCSQRVYVLASRLPSSASAEANKELPEWRRIRELARRDANFCGITMRILVRGLLPILTALVSGIALLVLDPALSLILFAVLAVAAVFFYRISIRAASYLAVGKSLSKPFAQEGKALLNRVAASAAPLGPQDTGLVAIFRGGAAAKWGNARVGQRQIVERGNLVAQVAMGCALFAILLIQGSATLRSENNWSALLAYLAVFSVFAANVSNAVRVLIGVNRFYPSLGAYARFVKSAMAPRTPTPAVERYRLDARSFDDGAGLESAPGERLALVTAGRADRHALTPLAVVLRGLSQEAVAAPVVLPWFATGFFVPLAGTLRENFGFPAGYDRAQLEADLVHMGYSGSTLDIAKGLDVALPAKALHSLDGSLAFVLAALAGIRGNHGVVVLEQCAFAALPSRARDALLDAARRSLLLLAYTPETLAAVGTHGESALIISAADQVVGWSRMSAYRSGDQRVRGALEALSGRPRAEDSDEPQGDDLDELV